MAKPIPTRVHAVLDYMTASTFIALPRIAGWDDKVTRLLTAAGGGVLAYSLLTDYELGVVKVLPMMGHLILDGMGGALLGGAPFLFLVDEDSGVKSALIGLGLMEIGAALLTQPASA